MKHSRLVLILAAALAAQGHAGPQVNGPMAFKPVSGSAYGVEADPSVAKPPWVISDDYMHTIVPDLNLYVGNDWNDMNTVNETGPHAGHAVFAGRAYRAVLAVDGRWQAKHAFSRFPSGGTIGRGVRYIFAARNAR